MKKNIFYIMAMAMILTVSAVQETTGIPVVTAAAVKQTPAKKAGKKYYVTSEVLNVRSGPGTDYRLIGSLSKGMIVKVFSIEGEKRNQWAKVRFQGVTAYVSVKYLAKK